MGYNYRNGMPDYHASATELATGTPGVAAANPASIVQSPNPSSGNTFMQSFEQNPGQAIKGYLANEGAELAKEGVTKGIAALAGLL